jgi:alkylation response protein AidB-like acyl-CoA dehydrogenase
MNLAPTDEQRAVQEAARRLLAAQLTPERRATLDEAVAGYDDAFWSAVAGAGWLGYALPERTGGQGASLLDLGLLIEECGRAAAPFGIFAAVTGGLALEALGTTAQRNEWLPRVATGDAVVTLAVAEAAAENDPGAFATTTVRAGGRVRVAGEKRFVLQGIAADALIVIGRDGAGATAVLVPTTTPGVRTEPLDALAHVRQSRVTFDDVDLPDAAVMARPSLVWPGWQALRARLAALLCADMVGGAQATLDMTVAHVCDREQFGVKLGTFQAVQQMVATMALALEGARHVTRQALWQLAEGLPSEREVAIAKTWTSRAFREITVAAHQLHGGVGYVREHELPRHSLRAMATELLFGSSEEWLEDLAHGLRLETPGRLENREG